MGVSERWVDKFSDEQCTELDRIFETSEKLEVMVRSFVGQLQKGFGSDGTMEALKLHMAMKQLTIIKTGDQLLALALGVTGEGGFPSIVARTLKLRLMKMGFYSPSDP